LTAVQQWQEWIRNCRREQPESEEQVWQRLAAWYINWTRHNDYVEIVLPRLLKVVGPAARVLEVGPGSGAFTLPLAAAVREVVAVEPSPAMRNVLYQRLAEAGLANVHIIPQPIETGLTVIEGCFDLALAAHSLYQVEPIEVVLRGLVDLAPHVAILMDAGEQREWYRALYRRFKGKEPFPYAHFRHFYPVLLAMDIYADVELLWTSFNYVYDCEDSMVDWWLDHFQLAEADRSGLQAALGRVAERRGEQIGIYDRCRTALIWIDRDRHILHRHNMSDN
jgi:SAM-dependent methyltransferase